MAVDIEALKVDVQRGREMVARHRRLVAALEEADATPQTAFIARQKLKLVEEAHTEDLAELRRLTTN